MPEQKPYVVRYKAGSDRSIAPGIHGRFATLAEAKKHVQNCSTWFGGGKKNAQGVMIGRAIVAIVVDQVALAKQKEDDDVPDELANIVAPAEVEYETETDLLKAENQRLKAKLAMLGSDPEDEEDEENDEPEEDDAQPAARKLAKA